MIEAVIHQIALYLGLIRRFLDVSLMIIQLLISLLNDLLLILDTVLNILLKSVILLGLHVFS